LDGKTEDDAESTPVYHWSITRGFFCSLTFLKPFINLITLNTEVGFVFKEGAIQLPLPLKDPSGVNNLSTLSNQLVDYFKTAFIL